MIFSKILPGALLVISVGSNVALASEPPVIRTDNGLVGGVTAHGVSSFKGIPFAAAPVGPLRWRPPQPAPSWSAVRSADQYGNDCMQKPIASDAAPLGTPPSEDCLYLNVWKPAAAASKKPVLVWIYGGGFMNGGASPPVYSGEELAKQGILVVSFNYRVGRFGFFAHPQLTTEQGGTEAIGNYGFMDQIAALKWVQRNIEAFGGDPSNVTVAGESAGGMSIHTLLTSPQTRSLFQRVVIQSGGDGALMMNTLAKAQQAGVAFAATQGIATDNPDAITKLRALPAEQIKGDLNMNTLFQPPSPDPTFTMPMYDGQIAMNAPDAYRSGQFIHVPVMIGATSDDLFGQDGAMVKGAATVANLLGAAGIPVYRYRFSYVGESSQAKFPLGAKHAGEIPYFFSTYKERLGNAVTRRDEQLSATARNYLVNFVKQGDPNDAHLVRWPLYDPQHPTVLDFGKDGRASVIAQ